MLVTHLTKKERLHQSKDHPPLFLTTTLPQFSINNEPCELPNQTLLSLAEQVTKYLKNGFWENQKGEYSLRHPVDALIYTKVYRFDQVLLSFEITLHVEQKKVTLLEKHIYLHFSNKGRLPLTPRNLIGKQLSCLQVSEHAATDPTSGKVYALKKKYQKQK